MTSVFEHLKKSPKFYIEVIKFEVLTGNTWTDILDET